MADEIPDKPAFDAEEAQKTARELTKRCQRITAAFLERQADQHGFQMPDPIVISRAFFDLGAAMMRDPDKLAWAQAQLWQGYADIWQAASKRLAGEEAEPVVEPDRDDKRFKDDAWTENAVFDTLKQSYLLTAKWMQGTFRDVDGLDPKTREKVDFYTRQWVNAWSPTNFAATNPKVLQKTIDTKGENLVKGLGHLLDDLEKGQGQLRISMTDADAFTLGENVATTPGKIVFENDLMQLIQYTPATDTVAKRPLLIVPPWINKFYILDLQPKNSFIKWAVDQGHTVFVISWVNPGSDLSHKAFEDYMLEGPLVALDAIKAATKEKSVNVIGYCIGGTLTACALAYLAAKGQADKIASATFFTTMMDFSEPGELGVFIDEEQLSLLERHMAEKGYLEGSHMSQVFNMMRDNDLIWSFVVNNYLMGREPMAFDLLYWNSDNTRMPAMMHGMYLRKMYLENRLVQPGGIELAGVPIDLSKIETPVYMLSTMDDHIAPWKSTYRATQIYGGPFKFVLSASGHIAGVINPPAANKYCYWTNAETPADPDKFVDAATRHEGSWWPDWQDWVGEYSDGSVKARAPGDGKLTPIEDAPGRYVKARTD
ncbi:MAG: class I poly(R)-hydroxyalkanoic acid synthase [Rhodospirillaceae bacterium]